MLFYILGEIRTYEFRNAKPNRKNVKKEIEEKARFRR